MFHPIDHVPIIFIWETHPSRFPGHWSAVKADGQRGTEQCGRWFTTEIEAKADIAQVQRMWGAMLKAAMRVTPLSFTKEH